MEILNSFLIPNNIIERMNVNILPFYIPVVEINGINYCLLAVNKLQYSMKILSSNILGNIERILINGIHYQTNIYINNIDDYINWYFSFVTRQGRRRLNRIINFFTGEHPEERFFIDNFNRIINNNTNFDDIIINDLSIVIDIIHKLILEYLGTLYYLQVNNINVSIYNTISRDRFIEPFSNSIFLSFRQVIDILETTNINANDFLPQDIRAEEDAEVNLAAGGVNLAASLAGIKIPGLSFAVDFIRLQAQRELNEGALRQLLTDRITEKQNNKIARIYSIFHTIDIR